MKLRDLFDEAKIDPQAEAIAVTGLAVDSRMVKRGDLFFALAGSKTDGARFVDAAISAGAVAVAGDHAPRQISVPFVSTSNPRRALALAAARFFSLQPATIAAVTGTSGKTGTAEKVVNGRYARKRVLTAFTAIIPADKPRYQLLIMLDEPQALKETYGFITSGWNAVPTAANVITRIGPLLGIEPRFDLPPPDRLILAASKTTQ